MKKKLAKPLIITGSILAVLLVAVIVLCAVSIKPFKQFYDYKTVFIDVAGNSNVGDITAESNKELKAKLDKGLEKSGFSVMHSLLEGALNYGPDFAYDKDKDGKVIKDDNGVKQITEKTFAEVVALTTAADSAISLEFVFSSEREMEVDGAKVKYDRVRLNVSTTNGEVQRITIYPFLDRLTHGVNADVSEYRINPVEVRANTSPLYIALNEIVEAL